MRQKCGIFRISGGKPALHGWAGQERSRNRSRNGVCGSAYLLRTNSRLEKELFQ